MNVLDALENRAHYVFNEHPTTLSLFSGAGGLDIGFHCAGFHIIACVEIDKTACETLRLNRGAYLAPDCRVITADIREIEPEHITREKVDFIIGGPPCQSFSAIGRRAGGAPGTLDARGTLFEHYCKIVDHFKPVGFLFENVRGILSSHKGQDWQKILAAFESIGYTLSYKVLDAADYGVPQHRERLIMVGLRQNQHIAFPRPTHGPDSSDNIPYVSAARAIRDISGRDLSGTVITAEKYGHLLKEVPPGSNYLFFTREMGYPNPIFAWRSRFSDFLYKADPEKPVRTIVAQLGAYSGPFHWDNRKFSLSEFQRLQSFPDDYLFAGGTNAVLKQIGNSVPPLFATVLAQTVKCQIFGSHEELTLLNENERLGFDKRKKTKAMMTRSKRTAIPDSYVRRNQKMQLPLFAVAQDIIPASLTSATVDYKKQIYYSYPTYANRVEIATLPTRGRAYTCSISLKDGSCTINVQEVLDRVATSSRACRVILDFEHSIGKNVQAIIGNLYSTTLEDICILWDCIEDGLSIFSGYHTMMDIYGHFTEPHPIFSVDIDVARTGQPFLENFITWSKQFSNCKNIVSLAILSQMAEGRHISDPLDLVKYLRVLRFDIRVNATNPTIPNGYFRCCYPFTLNVSKQVSVTWKEDAVPMQAENPYTTVLTRAYSQATTIRDVQSAFENYILQEKDVFEHRLKVQMGGSTIDSEFTVASAIKTIISNLKSSKYIYSILLTALVVKIIKPEQDIRRIQTEMQGGYSNRNTDAHYITPFLKQHGLTAMAASGMESGRNLERPYPHDLTFACKVRGAGNRESYLGLLHAVQVEGIDPFPMIVLLMANDLTNSAQNPALVYTKKTGTTIEDIYQAVLTHHQTAKGNGKARLPVLAIQAIYQCLTDELSRFDNCILRNPANRHTGNDKDGWIGDVQVDREDGTPFEAIEVKAGKQIMPDMVTALLNKFRGQVVDRYYILSNEDVYIASAYEEEVKIAIKQVQEITGCQIITNGLNKSLWYYLRLLADPREFIRHYTEQLATDPDVKTEHRQQWAALLDKLA